MSPKTKAFLKELSDLLCKYDAEIYTYSYIRVNTDVIVDYLDENEVEFPEGILTWQEIDRMLEDEE